MNENVNAGLTSSGETSGTGSEPLADEAKQALTRASSKAREDFGDQIEARKGQAAEALGGVARAIRDASKDMKEAGPLPEIADRAANMIQRVADLVERRSLGDVAKNVEAYARREPAIFVASAFALGLVAGRFLRSSSRSSTSRHHEGGERLSEPRERFGTSAIGGSGRGTTLPGEH